jgi:hypothetical protein
VVEVGAPFQSTTPGVLVPTMTLSAMYQRWSLVGVSSVSLIE